MRRVSYQGRARESAADPTKSSPTKEELENEESFLPRKSSRMRRVSYQGRARE